MVGDSQEARVSQIKLQLLCSQTTDNNLSYSDISIDQTVGTNTLAARDTKRAPFQI